MFRKVSSVEASGKYPPNRIFLCLSFLNPSLIKVTLILSPLFSFLPGLPPSCSQRYLFCQQSIHLELWVGGGELMGMSRVFLLLMDGIMKIWVEDLVSWYLGIIGGNWFPSSLYVFEYIQIYASPKYSSQPPANGGEGGIWIFQSISQSRKETCVEICQGIILQMIQFWYIKLPANWGNIGLRIQKPKLVDAPSAPLIQPFPKSKTQIHKSWKTRNRVAKCHISQGYVCAKNWVMKFGRTQMLINIWECQILWISWHYLVQISTSTTIHIQLINQVGLSIYLFKRGKI